MAEPDLQESAAPHQRAVEPDQTPNHVVKAMYLEINNIAQGLNVGLFVLVLTTPSFYNSFASSYYSTPLFALTSLVISIIFWTRYYFDTEILNRSFTVLSAFWFFAYVTSQGLSIYFVSVPFAWLLSTGVFLFFGSGFYALNLAEIRRKRRAGLEAAMPDFEAWQRRRMVELMIFSGTSLIGAALVAASPVVALPAAALSLIAALWQLALTDDYRRRKFIETGI